MAYFLGFRGDSSISLSQAVRDRTGQAAFLRDPRAGPSAQVGWRQVKVSSTFSKGRYVPVGRCPAADRGGSREVGCGGSWCPVGTVQDRPRRQPRPEAPAFPYFQKKGDVCPPLGVPPRPGLALCAARRAGAALLFFHRLRRLRPWSSAPHLASFLKKT